MTTYSQKLKKADRIILSNLQSHIKQLNLSEMEFRKAGTSGEKLASDYISKYLTTLGFSPASGITGSWIQPFEIKEGKKILPATSLSINDQSLTLYNDYFPLPFSASQKAEGTVAIALREEGHPWFTSLDDIIEEEILSEKDIVEIIFNKTKQAAGKGASALIIYDVSGKSLQFDSLDHHPPLEIPVVYLKKEAFFKYCAEESAVVDIILNVSLTDIKKLSGNFIGYADHKADSTLLISTNIGNENNVAALLEIGRLLKSRHSKKYNSLFLINSAEKNGATGASYFQNNAPIDLTTVHYTLNLDTLNTEDNSQLSIIKKSMELLNK